MDNHYKTLGVPNFASLEDIKEAYRKLSKKFHPDLNEGDKFFENKFRELQSVYETLSNAKTRLVYDENLKSYLRACGVVRKTIDPPSAKTATARSGTRRESPYVFHKGRFVRRKRF